MSIACAVTLVILDTLIIHVTYTYLLINLFVPVVGYITGTVHSNLPVPFPTLPLLSLREADVAVEVRNVASRCSCAVTCLLSSCSRCSSTASRVLAAAGLDDGVEDSVETVTEEEEDVEED